MLTARVAGSLDKSERRTDLTESNLVGLGRLCGSSEFFGEMVAANPDLISSLTSEPRRQRHRDYRSQLRAAIEPEKAFAAEFSAFRREWSRLLIEIGAQDAAGSISLSESNNLQTELAVASLNVAYLIARREMARRFGRFDGGASQRPACLWQRGE